MNNIKRQKWTIKKLIRHSAERDKTLGVLSFAFACLSTMYEMVLIFFPKKILEQFLIKDIGISLILKYVIVFIILGCLSGMISNYIREVSYARVGYLRMEYLADAFKKIITSDYKYMEDASFLNKYDSAFDACSNETAGIEKVYNNLFEIPMLLLKLVLLSIVIIKFSFGVIILSFFYSIVSYYVKKKVDVQKYKYRIDLSKISRKKRYFNNITQDFMYGKDIRLFKYNELFYDKYNQQIIKYKNINELIEKNKYLWNIIPGVIFAICQFFIYGILCFKVKLSIADITMYFVAINIFIATVNGLVINIISTYVENLFVYDYFKFIDAEIDLQNNENEPAISIENYDIEFKNFSFKYPNTDKYVLQNINFSILENQKIAIVGENGIGKTTLVKVLVGLFREFDGDITIGGKSIKDFPTKQLFEMFSVVFQDISMLSFSVAENIAGCDNGIIVEKIYSSLKQVELEKKIRDLKNGINSQLHKYFEEDGIELSGGEYQKMAIARALYKDSKILILDEPTASLDSLAEKKVYEKFSEISKGKTTIFISHRLSSTQFCDKIIVVGQEGILEEGNHKDLMDKKGVYYDLYSTQAKYYQKNEDE